MSGSESQGRLARLERAGELPWLCVVLVLFAVQQFAIRRLGIDGVQSDLRRGLFLVIAVLFMGLALHYRRYFGAWVMAAGIGLNLLPIIAHGGLMPVSYATVHDSGVFPEITRADVGKQLGNGKDILLDPADIRFPWLSDRFVVTMPLYGANIYSLGDFVLFTGVVLVVVQLAATEGWRLNRQRAAGEPFA
ncbi:MAG: DUF5317 family protein [Tepidiformaceae bacterium]